MKCIDIVKWLDDKNYPLHKCYKNSRHYGYKDANAFLQDLKKYVDELSKSTLDFWCGENGGINISRCLKGLKGLDATSTEVKNLLKALTTKITASDAILDAQAIGNGLYGLQKMDATSAVVLELITILEAKMPHIEDLLLNKWVINQLSSSYISLSETIRDQTERQNFLECRFSKLGIFKNAISNYKEQFIIKLLNEHLQDNQLDLHGLDHLTVKYLLSGVKILGQQEIQIIFGKASHSNHGGSNLMQAIVDKWVQGNNLQHCCVANGGIYSVKTTNDYTNRSASDCIDLLGAETYLLS